MGRRRTRRLGALAIPLALVLGISSLSYAASSLDEGIKELVRAIVPQVQKLGKKRIAVVDFTDLQGRVMTVGRFVADELSALLVLAGGGIRVVDRQHLARIIQEQKLAIYGVTDPQAVKRLGQLAGADVLIAGTVTDLGERVRITAKVLSTSTADIVGAAQTTVPKDTTVQRLLAEGTVRQTSTAAPKTPSIGLPLSDSFDLRPSANWRVLSGQWVVRDGMYTVEQDPRGSEFIALIGSPDWANYLVEIDVDDLNLYDVEFAILLRVQDRSNFVRLQVRGRPSGDVFWVVRENGVDSPAVGAPFKVNAPRIHMRVQVKGQEYSAAIDGASTSFVFSRWAKGFVGLMVRNRNPRFDNFSVTPVSE